MQVIVTRKIVWSSTPSICIEQLGCSSGHRDEVRYTSKEPSDNELISGAMLPRLSLIAIERCESFHSMEQLSHHIKEQSGSLDTSWTILERPTSLELEDCGDYLWSL